MLTTFSSLLASKKTASLSLIPSPLFVVFLSSQKSAISWSSGFLTWNLVQKLVGLVTNSKYQIFHTCLKINFSWVFSKFYVIWPHNSLLHVEILRIFDLWFSSCAIWRFTWDDDHQRDLAETSLRENETDHLSRIQCKACWCSVNQALISIQLWWIGHFS